MRPVFLEFAEVLAIHRDQIERYGGEPGIREIGSLQSAVATPQAGAGDEFLHRDLFEMAAAYLFHIVQNHPFVDGNKRAGAVAAIVFLELNGIELEADEIGLAALVRKVAEGEADKTHIAAFFRGLAR